MWRKRRGPFFRLSWWKSVVRRWCTMVMMPFLLLGGLNVSRAFAQTTSDAESSTGPELWGELWEPAWEGGWFRQATPWTLDLSVGRRTYATTGPNRDAQRAEVYALARVNVPWEGLLLDREIKGLRRTASVTSSRALNQKAASPMAVEEKSVSQEESLDESNASHAHIDSQPSYASESGDEIVPSTGRQADKALQADQAAETETSFALLRLVRETLAHLTAAEATRVAEARLESLVRRSRHSGMVPELRLRGVYAFDQTTSLEDAAGIYPGETTTRGGRDSLLEARMTFRLDRLVFGAQESSLERQRVAVRESEAERVHEALDDLMAWRIAESRSKSPELHPEEQLKAQGQAEVAMARLHVETKGWFRGRGTTKALGIDELLFPSTEPELAHVEPLDTVSHGHAHGSVQVRKPRDRRAGEGEAAFNEGQGRFLD